MVEEATGAVVLQNLPASGVEKVQPTRTRSKKMTPRSSLASAEHQHFLSEGTAEEPTELSKITLRVVPKHGLGEEIAAYAVSTHPLSPMPKAFNACS